MANRGKSASVIDLCESRNHKPEERRLATTLTLKLLGNLRAAKMIGDHLPLAAGADLRAREGVGDGSLDVGRLGGYHQRRCSRH